MRKILKNKLLEVSIEVILLTCTSYLLIQRATGFSISGSASKIFHTEFLTNALPKAKVITGIVISLCVVFKIIFLIRDKIGKSCFDHSDTGKFIEVISLYQNTTIDLIKRIVEAPCCCKSKISDHQRFCVFVQGIAKNLCEYVAMGFKSANVRRRNMFVSMYEHVSTEEGPALKHLFHIDSKRYDINSPLMLIEGGAHKDYECVRAINEKRSLIVVLNADTLRVKGRKRHKTMTHYIGAPVKVADQLVGFLNLEFHREKYFSNEEELEDFAQNFFLPFQMLIEQAFAKWQLAQSIEQNCGCNK